MTKTTRKPLTVRQQEIFDFIESCIAERYPPTIREISHHFGFSEKAAYDFLTAIEKKGYIQRVPHSPRTIRIVEDSSETEASVEPETLIIKITPEINIKAKGFAAGEYIRIRRQPYGVSGETVLMDANGTLTLYRLTSAVSNIIGKVVGHTIPIG